MTALQPRPSPLAGTAAGLGVDGVPLRSITGTHPVPFRSPLLRESRLMLLPRGTEMFQFPRCPPVTLCIRGAGHDARTSRGCPIRIRTALRSLAAPRPRFAALRVLLRPLTPRHPPPHPSPLGLRTHTCVLTHAFALPQLRLVRWYGTSGRLRPDGAASSSRFGKIEANMSCGCEGAVEPHGLTTEQ